MKTILNVQGSTAQAQPVIYGKDTVYVHTNIVQLEVDNEGNPIDNLWQYDETQYTYAEYTPMLAKMLETTTETNEMLEDCIIELATEIYGG